MQSQTTVKNVRLYYLDWLRVLAIFMVFLFHSVHVFDLTDWSIKNAERSELLTIILVLLSLWGMPFFFLIAGTSSIFALRRRTPSQYVRERFNRLLIPYIVGTILFWFPMVYLEWVNKTQLGLVTYSFQANLSGYWTFYANLGLSPLWFPFGKHLWFLGFLFAFAIISLPILLWLKRDQGARVIGWLARVSEYRGGILVFVLPLWLVRTSVHPFFPKEHDWSDFAFLLSFFILGFILTRTSRNQTGFNLMSNSNWYMFRFAQLFDGAKRWKHHFFLRNTRTV
ncbi:MAG: acyltransferase family protein, partial [Chloroflexi bacterium]|nr:acyltransferase family protein [Chloroflexota bacterium]